MKIFGVNAGEIIALIVLLGAAYCGEQYGSHYGNFFSLICTAAFPIGLLCIVQFLAWLEREFLLGQKPYPKCLCGAQPIDELEEKLIEKRMVHSCECGRAYFIRYIGRLMLIQDAQESIFATWKPFRGWTTLNK